MTNTNNKIWMPDAFNYSKGTYPYDPVTKTRYTQEEALKQPKEVRRRIVNKMVIEELGCWVNKE